MIISDTFNEAWNKLNEASHASEENIDYTVFLDAVKNGGEVNLSTTQWELLKAKYSRAKIDRDDIYFDQENNDWNHDLLKSKESGIWLYNAQLMINAFIAENDAIDLVNTDTNFRDAINNKDALTALINNAIHRDTQRKNKRNLRNDEKKLTSLAKQRRQTYTINVDDTSNVNLNFDDSNTYTTELNNTTEFSPKLNIKKLANSYEFSGGDKNHTNLLSNIYIDGGKTKADLISKGNKNTITDIEVKLTLGTPSGMPKETKMHDADIVLVYSLKNKKVYVYYRIRENSKAQWKEQYIRLDLKLNRQLTFIKLLPTDIRVEQY